MADNDNGNLMWIYQFELPQQCCNRCIEGTHRYVLGAFKKYPPARDKVLICIGLNPNTGIPGRLEKTVQAINDFAFGNEIKDEERNKIQPWPSDGWIMLNLSPIRCGNSDSLSSMIDDKIYEKAHERNIKIIKSILERYPDAVRLAGWGDGIKKKKKKEREEDRLCRSYLRATLKDIIDKENEIKEKEDMKWYCCCLQSEKAVLTEEGGNPRHFSTNLVMSLKKTVLNKFDISSYQTELEKEEEEEEKKKEKKNM